jgi:hypothetical protein
MMEIVFCNHYQFSLTITNYIMIHNLIYGSAMAQQNSSPTSDILFCLKMI